MEKSGQEAKMENIKEIFGMERGCVGQTQLIVTLVITV